MQARRRKRPLSVAFYSDSTIVGGAEVVLGTLLSALDPELDVSILGVDPAIVRSLAARRPSARMSVLPLVGGRRDASGFKANLHGIAAMRPTIFQANVSGAASCQHALLAATLLPGVRTIAVEHAAVSTENRSQRELKRLTARFLSAHVAPGERSAREIEELHGLRPGSVQAIHNGVPDVELTRVARPSEGPVIGAIGRLERQKNYDVLISAVAALGDATLVLVGDGPQRAELERQVASLGISDRVRFEGWHEDARDYLTCFDVFAHPSRLDTFPLVILEAMLARVPVVATPVGDVADAIIDGETGLLVPADDPVALAKKLRTLLDAPDRRRALAQRAREHALQWDPQRLAAAYELVYAAI